MKLYFAHPVNVYNTPLEDAMLKLIAYHFPGVEIVNPNTPEYQKMYSEMKAATGGTHGAHQGMDIFYKMLGGLDGCVAMPFRDCRMGLGVASEMQKTVKAGKPGWMVVPRGDIDGFFRIRPLTEEEARILRDHPGDLKDNPPAFVVGHEETRLRTFIQYGGKMRPYDEAHKVKLPVPEDFYALDPKKK